MDVNIAQDKEERDDYIPSLSRGGFSEDAHRYRLN